MKRKLIVLSIILIFAGFIWFKYIKHGKYVANGVGGDIIDGSDYVESGEYYFNCDIGFFVKRVPPKLDTKRLKEGKFTIPEKDYRGQKLALQKYIQLDGWEAGFEYTTTGRQPSVFRDHPDRHFFDKFVKIDGKDYQITIIQPIRQGFPLDISIWEGHPSGANGKTHAEAIEKAKNSCPDPQ